MLQTKKWTLILCALLLSTVSFFWLTSHLSEFNFGNYEYHQQDPDSLLFMRLLEQSILRGEVYSEDEYACYPFKMEQAFSPFYLNFLTHVVWLFHTIFPESTIDPILICGWLPILFFWLTGMMIFGVVVYLSLDVKFWLFLTFFMLPGVSAVFVGRFLLLDYDYLISFYIWAFILAAAVYHKRQSGVLILVASLVVVLFTLTWLGTPLFFLLVTLYGFWCWLYRVDYSDNFLLYSSSALITGSILVLGYVARSQYAINLFASAKFSYFQPLCILLGGCFLRFLLFLSARKNYRIVGIISLAVGGVAILLIFRDSVASVSGFLFKSDPLLKSIAELAPLLSLDKTWDGAALTGLVRYFSWPILLLPIFLFASSDNRVGSDLKFLRDWLVIMVALTIYQTRYVRWLGAGYGLFCAMVCYLLWGWCKKGLQGTKYANLRIGLAFFPMLVILSLSNFAQVSTQLSLENDQVDLYSWISRNTPKTSGYDNRNRPEYSILSFWDEGNKLSYYAKRPATVGNYIWGYQTMASVFSATNEKEADDLCERYGIKYILISSRTIRDDIYDLWKYLKSKPVTPEYMMVTEEIPHYEDYNECFHYHLQEKLGLSPSGNFGVLDRFRVVYTAKIIPKFFLFERVLGAKANLVADPDSTVTLSLELRFSTNDYLYKRQVKVGNDGKILLNLPYSTSQYKGRVRTDEFYKLTLIQGGQPRRYKIFVSENAVIGGQLIPTQDIAEVSEADKAEN